MIEEEVKKEIKRCPFCGRLPIRWKWNYGGATVECLRGDHRVQCDGKTLEDAIEAWNRRAEPPRYQNRMKEASND